MSPSVVYTLVGAMPKKEELAKIKQEYEDITSKLNDLNSDELFEVTGGINLINLNDRNNEHVSFIDSDDYEEHITYEE